MNENEGFAKDNEAASVEIITYLVWLGKEAPQVIQFSKRKLMYGGTDVNTWIKTKLGRKAKHESKDKNNLLFQIYPWMFRSSKGRSQAYIKVTDISGTGKNKDRFSFQVV